MGVDGGKGDSQAKADPVGVAASRLLEHSSSVLSHPPLAENATELALVSVPSAASWGTAVESF